MSEVEEREARELHEARRYVWAMRAHLNLVEAAVNEGRLGDAQGMIYRLHGSALAKPSPKGKVLGVLSWVILMAAFPIIGYNTFLNVMREPTTTNVIATVLGILTVAIISWFPLLATIVREYKERN